ncbi:hypothetical protein QOZ89_42680 [Pseudofrankia sp. BMG5.37]|nr:hypothetical protein [Pseudofrankia sp. BMG5.37]MDT3445223.1 hypothetical protein [Pseudofrankia sp. BMG5.37]MDT3446237.1 hypothetical protein [Pseudofrankia sp. BMG5.37]
MTYVLDEHRLGRMLDYGVIQPRLQRLYEWSALELDLPGLRDLVRDGSPVYAWPYEDRDVWTAGGSLPERVLGRATSPR